MVDTFRRRTPKYRDWAGEFIDANLESGENAHRAAREGVDFQMGSVSAAIDLEPLHSDLLAVEGTEEVHYLRVWRLAPRQFALAVHR